MASRTFLWTVCVLALAASAARPAEMRGRVLVDGAAAAGVTVAILPFEDGARQARREARGEGEPKALAEGVTRKDGSFAVAFEVPAASGENPVRLRISGERTAPRVLGRLLDPTGEVVGDVRITSGEELAGRVQDERGGPVVGATARLWAGRGGQLGDDLTTVEPVVQTVTTGADGTFRFEAVAEAGNRLRIDAPGLATVERSGLRGGALARPVTLALGQVLRGTVTLPDRRTPPTGAVVRYEGRSTTRWSEVRSDGSFVLEGVPATGGGQIVVDAGEQGRGVSAVVTGSRDPVQVVLAPTAALSGLVVDAQTAGPIPGVRLVSFGDTIQNFAPRDWSFVLCPLNS